jgi:hypothetical protein
VANIFVASDKPSVNAVLGKTNPLVLLVHLIVTVLAVKSQLQVAGQFEPNEAAFILFIISSDMKKNSLDFIFFLFGCLKICLKVCFLRLNSK